MASTDYTPFSGSMGFDIAKDPKMLGRLKLPYKSFNFLALLSRQYGKEKYDSARDIMELCQWMYVHVSDIRNIINRLSEYIITDIQIDDTHTPLDKDEQYVLLNILEKLKLKPKLVQIAKSYFATGNAITSIDVKIRKHLECPKCTTVYNIARIDFRFDTKGINYIAKCQNSKCGYKGPMNVMDQRSRTPESINIKLWDWHDIEFNYNPISDEYRYYYKIPVDIYKGLMGKEPDPFLLETTPHNILKEIFSKKKKSFGFQNSEKSRLMGFPPNKVRHIKNDSVMSTVLGGWGEPITIGVLQDAFFMQLLRQAQAVLLTDYVIPIRIVSPDPSAMQMMDLKEFASKFDDLYAQFQKDPLQIMKSPFPIQYQTMSAEGKSLFLSNEMDYTRQCIRRGIGVPTELLDGGMQNFSASNISLRMLENFVGNFISTVINDVVNDFFIPNICIILKIPTFRVSFTKFKAMDDVQQKQAKLNLYQMNMVADTDIYDDYGIKTPSEEELVKSVERRAVRDGKYQLGLGKFQAEIQSDTTRRSVQSQFEIAELQEKEQKIKGARQQQDADDPENAHEFVGGDPNAANPTADPNEGQQQQSQLQPPEELAEHALNQLTTQNELASFLTVLQKQMPDNPEYVKAVSDYINTHFTGSEVKQDKQNLGGQQPEVGGEGGPNPKKTNITGENTRPREKDGGVDLRPMPSVKPPRRQS